MNTENGEIIDQLIAELNSSDEKKKITAIEALGKTRDERAISALIASLKDGLFVQMAAASALAQIGNPAVEPLLAALKEPDQQFRTGIIRALGRLHDPIAIEPLMEIAHDANKDMRMAIWGALGLIGNSLPLEALINALKGDWDECLSAAEALGNIGDARAVEPLIDVLINGDYTIRGYVAQALGKIGDSRALPALKSIFNDPLPVSDVIKNSARDAIKAIEDKNP